MDILERNRLRITIPKRMRTLPCDERGYPVPFIVMTDKAGNPQFTINDHAKVRSCVNRKLCSICGKRHDALMWFVGGSRCFLHEHGAFIDPPLHLECAEYALRVCPFLAAPRYSKRVDDRKLKAENKPDDMALVRVDYMNPLQPEIFGLGAANDLRVVTRGPGDFILVVDDWHYVEWWKAGQMVNAPDRQVPEDQPMERHNGVSYRR
jgi:hypothetical protein